MTRLYISGPIRGNQNYKFHFACAASEIDKFGWTFFSPAELEPGHTNEWYMAQCISELLKCDGIVLLHGWEDSEGAKEELQVAQHIGLDVYTLKQGVPCKLKDNPWSLTEGIDHEARRVVFGNRNAAYGPATGDFLRTGKMWGAILEINEVPPEKVALCLAALKFSRLVHNPDHHDSQVDIIGYMLCYNNIIKGYNNV